MSDDWEEPPVFFGFGQCHTLRDEDAPSRLAGLRSVNTHVSLRDPPRATRRIGFHIPKRPTRSVR